MNQHIVRHMLEYILHVTQSADGLPEPGFIGGKAELRKQSDDVAAGRANWWGAHNLAKQGLLALDQNDLEWATESLISSMGSCIAALEKRVRPEDKDLLAKPARRRGRPASSVRKK